MVPQRPPSLHFADCRQRSSRQKKKGKADGLSTPPVIFHINSCPSCRTVPAEHRHLHGEETLRGRLFFFFFKFFIEIVFTVGVEILENGEESLQMCFIMILVPRQDLEERVFYSLEKIFEFYFGGRIPFLLIREETFFKEFLIFRIFLFFITEFGCSGKLQN